jgi:hypothetical protein
MLTLAGKLELIAIVKVFDVAGEPVIQVAFDVMMQVTVLPFVRPAFVYVELFDPTLLPFNCHWYVGVVPPLVAVAVNVTLVPAQIAPLGLAAIITLAGKFGFTIIVIIFDVAGEPVAHVAFDVMIHVIWLPLVSAPDV